MESLRKFFDTTLGKVSAGVVLVVACIACYVEIKNSVVSPAVAMERDRTFICSVTGKTFQYELQLGETIPVLSPYTNQRTGYPAEFCYWNKDGSIRTDPTPVLLNSWIGKPGPTFCPVCGRLVVPHNPMARPGMTPPPTQEEWEAEHAGQAY